MSAGQADARRWRASWEVTSGVHRVEEYSARELYRRFGWDNWSEQLGRIERQAVGDHYTDCAGWTWERIA